MFNTVIPRPINPTPRPKQNNDDCGVIPAHDAAAGIRPQAKSARRLLDFAAGVVDTALAVAVAPQLLPERAGLGSEAGRPDSTLPDGRLPRGL